jgi:hypothetical protein
VNPDPEVHPLHPEHPDGQQSQQFVDTTSLMAAPWIAAPLLPSWM